MVDMKCDGCVNNVKKKFENVDGTVLLYLLFVSRFFFEIHQVIFFCFGKFVLGVKYVEVELSNQVVRILGSTLVKTMTSIGTDWL